MATTTDESRPKRSYHSPARQQQAQETRERILASARELLRAVGYVHATLDRIAEGAGVSPKTVSAAYGSKVGILAALVLPTRGQGQAVIGRLREAPEPRRRVEMAAELCGTVYGELTPEFELLRGAGMLAPELAALARQIDERRRANGALLVGYLTEHGALRRGMAPDEATDVVWTLTAYDLYRALVVERNWQPGRYVAWLARLLSRELLPDEGATGASEA